MDDLKNETPDDRATRIEAVRRRDKNQKIGNNPFLREIPECGFSDEPMTKQEIEG